MWKKKCATGKQIIVGNSFNFKGNAQPFTVKHSWSMAGSPHKSAEYNYQNAFEILFVMLIGTMVFPFALCLHENKKIAKYSGSYIQRT